TQRRRRPRGSEPVPRVPGRAVLQHGVVQVASGGPAGGADGPDDLAALHVRPGTDGVAAQVVRDGGQTGPAVEAVVDDDPVAPRGLEVLLHDLTVSGGPDRGPARGAEVDPVVQRPVAVDRVGAPAE